MLLPLKMICEVKNIRRDGTAIIFILYCFNSSKRTQLNTGIQIPPKFWDDVKQRINPALPAEYGNAEVLNASLKKSFRCAEDIVAFAIARKMDNPLDFVKKIFTPDFDPATLPEVAKKMDGVDEKVNMDIYFQIDEYIKSRVKVLSTNIHHIFRNMKARLKAFEIHRGKPITFECLDYTFYEEFVEFMMYEYVQKRFQGRIGLKMNTIGGTIKQFRIFLKNRAMKKIIKPIDMEGWIIFEEDADAVYISWNEIWQIYNADLSDYPHLDEYRNDTVLACLTGLRFSDFSKLEPTDVRGDLLYKKQQKSKHWVVIPLRPEAKLILEKRFRDNVQPQTNPEFNRHIKTIAKLAGIDIPVTHSYKKGNKTIVETKPKYEWITSHTCRRSFCTNEFLAGTPVELIMKISGHKSIKDFYKYIRVTPEEAAAKIKELWESRAKEQVAQPLEKMAS